MMQKLTREEFRARYAGASPEYELIDGFPEQKPAAEWPHASLHGLLTQMLEELGFTSLTSLTLEIDESWELIPDVAGFLGPLPAGPYPSQPPAAAIEILSPNDPFLKLNRKLKKYAEWGIGDILVFDPIGREGWLWDQAVEALIPFDVYYFHRLPDAKLSVAEVFRREHER
jgi:Uma2 family endonuclease